MSTSDVSGLLQEELKRHAQIPGGRVASFAFKRGTRAERTWVENYKQDRVIRRHTNALLLKSSALVQEASKSPLCLGWMPYKGEIQSSGTEPASPN